MPGVHSTAHAALQTLEAFWMLHKEILTMQIRCYHCHKPFAIAHETVHEAIHTLIDQDLSHYNAYCPHCRRANRVSLQELQRAAPDWQREAGEEKTKSE